MRWAACFLVLIILTGAARADGIDLVKNTRNSLGISCSRIPVFIEKRLGFKTLSSKWSENKMDGKTRVSLKIMAQKEFQEGTLYMSYAWHPEWIWSVDDSEEKVTPVNTRAKNWMEGRI